MVSKVADKPIKGWCPSCFRKAGEYHFVGCDVERCPKCNKVRSSCGCKFVAVGKSGSFLVDAEEVQYKRCKI